MSELVEERRKIGFRFLEYENDCDFHLAGASSLLAKVLGVGTGVLVVGAFVCSLIMEMSVKVPVTGQMAPNEEINVFAKIEGPILKLCVKKGDVVQVGQVVAELDVRDRERKLDQLRLDLKNTEIKLERLGKELETTKAEYDNTLAEKKLQEDKAKATLSTQRARKVEELGVARQKLEKQQVTVKEVEGKRDKARGLLKEGIVARTEVDRVEADYKLAVSNREIAQRELSLIEEKYDSQIRQAEVELKLAALAVAMTATSKKDFIAKKEFGISSAKTGIEKLTKQIATEEQEVRHRQVRSSVSGVILKEVAKVGGYANLREPVLVAADTDDCVLKGYVAESRRRRLQVGKKARLEFGAYKDVKFPAEVLKISPTTEMIEGKAMYEVRMRVDKPKKRPMFLNADEEIVLLPGLTAKGDIYAEKMRAIRYLVWVKILKRG